MWPLRVIDPEVQFCRWSTYCGISSLCHVSMETYVKSHTVLNLCLKLLVILEEWIYPSDRSQINEIESVTISFAEFLLWTPFRFFYCNNCNILRSKNTYAPFPLVHTRINSARFSGFSMGTMTCTCTADVPSDQSMYKNVTWSDCMPPIHWSVASLYKS